MARTPAYNHDTGEVLELSIAQPRGRKRRKGKRKMFALTDLESLALLDLTGAEWRVLTRIMRAVNPETNEARITQTEIAEELSMAQPNVSRIVKMLRERRILFALSASGYRVNAHIMYRGSNLDWDTATDNEVEPVWTRP